MKNRESTEIAPRKHSRLLRVFVQVVLTLLVLAIGSGVFVLLVKLRRPPEKKEVEVVHPLVKVRQIRKKDVQMTVRGFGTVKPKVKVDLVPEVPGKVVHIHPEFEIGGFIEAGEEIVRIDPRDYELAVEQAEALVADAEVRLDTEVAEAEVAKREWEQLNPGTKPTSPLVLREPQIRQARAALESAEAQLAVAKLRLERTTISLPFDVRVISENVDVGQYVVSGQAVGSAYGINTVEIEVPLEDDELAWFDIPDNNPAKGSDTSARGTPATVAAEFAGAEYSWDGFVTRTSGQVDPTSRMVPVIVEVRDPFSKDSGKPELLPGIFVSVKIEGRVLEDAFAIPRDAIRGAKEVWVVNDGRLQVRSLKIVRTDKNFAYTLSDLGDTANIVVSTLDTVVDGMEVRQSLTGEDRGVAAANDANDSEQMKAD